MQQEEEVVYLYLDDIIPNRFQPREVFEERPLKELAVSIKEHGVIQPIIVRKVNDKYEIIAGERRYKASALAGLTKIPAIVRDLDDKESSKVALLENLQRKNLNPLEEARTYQKILEIDEMTQEELAKTMGKSQSAVANKIRLLSLSDEIQQALLEEKISERHARTLLNVKDHNEQKKILDEIINNKMTVRQLEQRIKGEKIDNSIDGNEDNSSELIINNTKDIEGQENYLSSSPLIPGTNSDNLDDSEPLIINSSIENSNDSSKLIEDNNNDDSDGNDGESKFINFGEIKEDSNSESDDLLISNTSEKQSLNEPSNNIMNISNNQGADLDSLLQINSSSINEPSSTSDFKFFSSAQDAINESEKESDQGTGDYFEAPDFNINIPGNEMITHTNNVSLSQSRYDTANEEKSIPTINFGNRDDIIQDGINLLRDSIKKMEENGLKVTKEEINMDNSYEIKIKIEK